MHNKLLKIDIFSSGWRMKLLLHHNVNRFMDMDNRNLKLDIFPLGWRIKLLLHHKLNINAKDELRFQASYYSAWNESLGKAIRIECYEVDGFCQTIIGNTDCGGNAEYVSKSNNCYTYNKIHTTNVGFEVDGFRQTVIGNTDCGGNAEYVSKSNNSSAYIKIHRFNKYAIS